MRKAKMLFPLKLKQLIYDDYSKKTLFYSLNRLQHSPAVPRVKCNAVELYSWYGRLQLLNKAASAAAKSPSIC
jgi:hypothetical protein